MDDKPQSLHEPEDNAREYSGREPVPVLNLKFAQQGPAVAPQTTEVIAQIADAVASPLPTPRALDAISEGDEDGFVKAKASSAMNPGQALKLILGETTDPPNTPGRRWRLLTPRSQAARAKSTGGLLDGAPALPSADRQSHPGSEVSPDKRYKSPFRRIFNTNRLKSTRTP